MCFDTCARKQVRGVVRALSTQKPTPSPVHSSPIQSSRTDQLLQINQAQHWRDTGHEDGTLSGSVRKKKEQKPNEAPETGVGFGDGGWPRREGHGPFQSTLVLALIRTLKILPSFGVVVVVVVGAGRGWGTRYQSTYITYLVDMLCTRAPACKYSGIRPFLPSPSKDGPFLLQPF